MNQLNPNLGQQSYGDPSLKSSANTLHPLCIQHYFQLKKNTLLLRT